MKVLGSCSRCGGQVVIPDIWHGIYPPRPTCVNCGATKKEPVIEMDKQPYRPTGCGNPICYCDGSCRNSKLNAAYYRGFW